MHLEAQRQKVDSGAQTINDYDAERVRNEPILAFFRLPH